MYQSLSGAYKKLLETRKTAWSYFFVHYTFYCWWPGEGNCHCLFVRICFHINSRLLVAYSIKMGAHDKPMAWKHCIRPMWERCRGQNLIILTKGKLFGALTFSLLLVWQRCWAYSRWSLCECLKRLTLNPLIQLISSCSCLCPFHWSLVLSREWRCSWSSADRRCSNYNWVINNCIAYYDATYIIGLTILLIWRRCNMMPIILNATNHFLLPAQTAGII